MPDRVVFDTNIWISGLLWRGNPYRCLLLAKGGVVQHVHCMEMVAELSEKLRATFGFSETSIQAVMYDFRRISERIEISGNLRVVDADPDDDKFVECAVIGSTMPKPTDPDDYELRDEYDLSTMSVVPKGRYAPDRRAGKNVVLLADDVVEAFPTDDAVNEALRLVMRIGEMPAKYTPGSSEP